MYRFFQILFFIFSASIISAQSNTNLLGSWDGAPDNYNDVWGYVDPAGNEYAIVGSRSKIWVVNVSGTTPSLVGSITPGNNSTWRDMKTYGTYAYGVADQSGSTEGLTVIDLSNLPTSISLAGQYNTEFKKAHNIFIDTNTGHLYVAGSSGGTHPANSGLIVYDLNTTPANPTRLVSQSLSGNGGYVHDVYVKNDTAYCSHGYNGFYVHDFTNTSSVSTIGGMVSYPQSGYNHSGWLTSDAQHYVVVDEVPTGKACKIAKTNDLTNINVPATHVFQDCLVGSSTACTPHNPYIIGNYVYLSYYHDGLVIFDISNPANVTRAGYYDTYSNGSTYSGYNGAWGCYPFLPSGKILVSDISNGLKVVSFSPNLPVELTSLRAKKNKDGSIALNWETHSEAYNDYFEVEKSADGTKWVSMEKIDGRGNANGIYYYHAKDIEPFEGMTFYRLKQVDFDGTFERSKAISIRTDVKSSVYAYPTIFGTEQESITVELPITKKSAIYTYQLFDLSGHLIQSNQLDAENGFVQNISVTDIPKGGYILQIETNSFSQQIQLVKH